MSRIIQKKLYHQQVYEQLKKDILTGKLDRGEKVNENMIAQEFGISRSPVREAIRMLEQDELVIMGAAGTIVNPLEASMLEELYESRVVMESYAVRSATPYYTEKNLEKLEELVEKSNQYYKEDRLDDIILCNTEFHDLLVKVCRNERLKKTIKKYQELSLLARRQEFYTYHRSESFIQEHMEIIQTIRGRDQDAVEMCMRRHLGSDLEFYRQNAYENRE